MVKKLAGAATGSGESLQLAPVRQAGSRQSQNKKENFIFKQLLSLPGGFIFDK